MHLFQTHFKSHKNNILFFETKSIILISYESDIVSL